VPPQAFEELLDIPLEVRVRLGEAEMTIEEIAGLGEGAAVALDRAPGDPVDVLVNDRLFARGEVAVVDDRFTVRITEILAPEEHRERKGSGV
jgi:flagellar motor switch protein FliN/FliY